MQYQRIYDEMISRNTRTIRDFGFKPDPRLNDAIDDRRCIAIYSELEDVVFHDAYDRVKCSIDQSKSMVRYDTASSGAPAVLHTTLMQLHTFGSKQVPCAASGLRERGDLRDLLRASLPVTVEFSRLCVTPAGITALGFPTVDLNAVRNQIRNMMRVEEPYVCDIVHSTLARFYSDPEMPIINELLGYDGIPLFTANITHWCVGKASWRLLRRECDVEFRCTI